MIVPGRTADVAAKPDTSPGNSVSGTASNSSSALPATSGTGATGVSGRRRSARCLDAWETALHATTTWSTRSSATPNAVPTRPAEMIPTFSRAGRNPSNCTIADDPHKSLGFVPVPRSGYRTVAQLYRDRWPRRCGVRLSLRGGGDARPRPGWIAAAPAGRPPTGHRTAAPRTRTARRCCDDERWPVAVATSPAHGLEPAAGSAVVEAAAVTSPVAGPRSRRPGRTARQSAATVRVDPIRSEVAVRFAGLAWRRFGGRTGMPAPALGRRLGGGLTDAR